MQLHLKPFLVILGLFLFVSCSSSKTPENDTDILLDADADVQDSETQDDDSDSQDSEIVGDSDEIPDADADSDTPEKVECLDLRYNENTIKTPFPFKDANGKPTFCRPGCDKPTENDPQCVRNIWEWDNWEEYQDYLKAQEKDPNQQDERECYPWPCKLPDMKAMTKEDNDNLASSCDRWLTTGGFSANDGVIWTHGMSDGVAGMSFGHSTRVVEYDPEKDEYSTLGHSYVLGFNENRYVVEIYDRNLDKFSDEKRFIVSIFRQNGTYYYELIYDNPSHGSFLSRSPIVGKNWVLIHVRESQKSSETRIKYASSKDWEWHELAGINNYAGEGNIVGDHLTFITNNRELYYCDLRKYPKHIDECFKLNRKNEFGEEELGHSPRIDIENEYRVVYDIYETPTFVEVDLKDLSSPKYTEHKVEKSRTQAGLFGPSMLIGNRVVYIESDPDDDVGCFYRFDKKKTYCPSTHTFTTYRGDDLMGFNVFWGKWHLWKMITRPDAFMRDWECYCRETGRCPLED
ncbi:hypothetical protein J5690_01955 [bacterium]|nr:hypothetical protein [bacterium]